MSGSTSEIKLIVGLGNPGAHYQATRHNVGAWFVESICEQYHLTLKTDPKLNAQWAAGNIAGTDCKLLIPQTYMNHSGQAIGRMVNFYKMPPSHLLIAHDELDLPVGTVRLKQDGGHGGHNGLRDTIHHLHSTAFARLRLGIGHPGHKEAVAQYVLERPSKLDEQKIRAALQQAVEILPLLLKGNWQGAMNLLHTHQ